MRTLKTAFIGAVAVLVMSSETAYGAAWVTKRLTNNSGRSEFPAVALNGKNLYVVWQDMTPGNFEIYFRKSTNGGVSWETPLNLSNTSGSSWWPAMAVQGDNIYVVWEDSTPGHNEVYFAMSGDAGVTWKAAERLTQTAGRVPLGWTSIAAYEETVYLLWAATPDLAGDYDYEIYFMKSTTSGTSWETSKKITSNALMSIHPDIAIDGQNLYVSWIDNTPGNNEIYFRKSTNGGKSWKTSKRLTTSFDDCYYPAIAVSGNNIYIVWHELVTTGGEYDFEILFSKSINGGTSWQKPLRLTSNSGESCFSRIAVNGNSLHVVWADGTPGNLEIYYMKSANSGASWQTPERLTINSGSSNLPSIATEDKNIYVVYQDAIAGNTEIFFKSKKN